jgi:putative transposase
LEIVRRCDHAGFQVQAKRWIVERTFAWLSRQRRLAKDYEYTLTSAAAFIHLAFIRLILRRLTRGTP